MKRRGNSQALYNQIGREFARKAEMAQVAIDSAAVIRCGCSVNALEADSAVWPCPCGEHCAECVEPKA